MITHHTLQLRVQLSSRTKRGKEVREKFVERNIKTCASRRQGFLRFRLGPFTPTDHLRQKGSLSFTVCTEYLTYWVEVMLCIEGNTSRLFSAQLYGTWNVLGTKVGDIYAQSQPWMLKGKQR